MDRPHDAEMRFRAAIVNVESPKIQFFSAKPYLMLGVNVVCAETDERARWLAAPGVLAFLRLRSGRPGRYPTPEEAAEYRFTPAEREAVRSWTSAHVVGSPATVRRGLEALVAETGADELIVTDSDYSDRQLFQIVDQAHRAGVKVKIAPKTTELLVQRAEYVPGQGVPLFELRPPVFAGAEWVLKRSFDLLVSGFVIVVGLPLWLMIAAAIKLTSRGPVFYRDLRIGLTAFTAGLLRTCSAEGVVRHLTQTPTAIERMLVLGTVMRRGTGRMRRS